MNLTVTSAPHIRSGNTTQRTMLDVLIALVPALIAGVVLFGLRALVLTVISAAGCVVAELLVNLVMRKKPTVGGNSPVGVETFLFDLDEDLYGKWIEVQLLDFIRPEMKFESLEKLKEQIERDKETSLYYFKKKGPER